MDIDPIIRAEIIAEHSRNPQKFSPFRTATAVGVSIRTVLEVVDTLEEHGAPRRTSTPEGDGREDLRPFIAAKRRAMTSGWDNDDPAIAKAREQHETGTHIMTTGRDGIYLLLYSIPRKGKAQPKPRYFSTEHA